LNATALFIGPTYWPSDLGQNVSVYPPAVLGTVYRAAREGFARIALVDGYFGTVPSVWHKEILHALAQGIEVWGAASMGALRASELWEYGMQGVGLIFNLYRRGALTDDDEVCVVHAPREFAYKSFSHAMVNVRLTARRMTRLALLNRAQERQFITFVKRQHFSKRTDDVIREALNAIAPGRGHESVEAFRRHYRDAKRDDARALIEILSGVRATPQHAAPRAAFSFPITSHWRQQFEIQLNDVPPLGYDVPSGLKIAPR
jgi:hypothetical protein